MSRQLLFSVTKKDLRIEYFSGSGAGGQHRNKHQNCVRIHHNASGAISTGQSNKSRIANTKEALQGLIKQPKFKVWHSRMCAEVMTGKTIDELVDESMSDENLKIEYQEDGRWMDIKDEFRE